MLFRHYYLNCGNELVVDVPALGNLYSPSFSATGAETFKGSKKGAVTVVPNKAKVVLSVSSGGALIGNEKFKVRKVPKPDIIPYSGGRPIDLKQGVQALSVRSINLVAKPDADFATLLPKEANFRVTRYKITLARGKRPVKQIDVNGPKASIGSLIQQAKPGDRLVIELKEVKRRNFKGKAETVRGITQNIFTVPLN